MFAYLLSELHGSQQSTLFLVFLNTFNSWLKLQKKNSKAIKVKDDLKTVWEGKMHGVTKIGIFLPLFCVGIKLYFFDDI